MQQIPHSREIESATVGTMMAYPDEDFSELVPDDFYIPEFGAIVKTILSMKSGWKEIDMVTIYDELKTSHVSVNPSQLAELSQGTWSRSSLSSYIRSLKEYRRKRAALTIANEIIHLADWEPSKLMDYSEKLSQASTIGSEKESSVSYDDVTKTYEQITSRFGKTLYGYSWWRDFGFLDEFTKWIVKKRVYRIWAPSNTGKTQFIYNLIPRLLEQKNEDWSYVKVAFFTLENTKEDTLVSLMCNHSWLNATLVNNGSIDWNWDYLTSLKNRLYIIDDIYDLDKILSKCVSIKPDVVILDYITHITVAKAQWMEKYDIYAERIPKFAKRQDLAWIDLSNLPKNLQTNEEIRSTPWFYGSSILMNNCDVSFHLMRNPEFKKTKDEVLKNPSFKHEDRVYFFTRNCLDLLITKNRWWSVFIEKTYWINFNNWWRWKELTQDDINSLWAKYG